MAPPQTWEELMKGPAYIINMDRDKDRFDTSYKRVSDAGFTNILRWRAIDAKNDDVKAAWEIHGSPRFDKTDGKFLDIVGHPYKQGTLLSHLALWKHMIESNIDWAVVFEDDLVFHKDWHQLAMQYFNATPKDYGLCYMGHHCGCGKPYQILKVPVYCTHATIVTREGAMCLYNKFINDENGVRAIDCLINHYMVMSLVHPTNKLHEFCEWYAWNAEMYPDTTANKHPDHVNKDVGLVFQDNIVSSASYTQTL